jgi:hypothetical protein
LKVKSSGQKAVKGRVGYDKWKKIEERERPWQQLNNPAEASIQDAVG